MSWLDPITIIFFAFNALLELICLLYFFSSLNLLRIGRHEGNRTKIRSGVRAMLISGLCAVLVVPGLLHPERYSLWGLFFGW